MLAYVDTRTLDGHALQFHATGPGAFAARVKDLVAGSISLRLNPQGDRWCWALTGPFLPASLQPAAGEAATLAIAQAQCRAKFEAWLAWAQGAPVMWNAGSGDRPARPVTPRAAQR